MGAEAVFYFVLNAIVATAVSYGTGLLVSAIVGGPKTPETPAPNLLSGIETIFNPTAGLPGIFGRRRVGLTIVFAKEFDDTTVLIGVIAGAPITTIHGIYMNNALVGVNSDGNVNTAPWSKTGDYAVNIRFRNGSQTEPDARLVSSFPALNLADYIGEGIPHFIIEYTPQPTAKFAEEFQSGLPDFTVLVDGLPCYDPRDPTHDIDVPSTWSTSDNPAIHAGNYIISPLGMAHHHSLVDWTTVATEADVCDEIVPTLAGSEPRYRCSAYWRTGEGQRHEEILKEIGACMAGGVVPPGDQYKIWSGRFQPPYIDIITPDDYDGEALSFSLTNPIENLHNTLRGKFISIADNWEERDYPEVSIAALVAQDGEPIYEDITYRFVTSPSQAQRLAKISLMTSRYGIPASLELNPGFLDIDAADVLRVTDASAAWTARPHRVMAREIGDNDVVQLDLRYEAADFYEHNPLTDEREYVAESDADVVKVLIPTPGISATIVDTIDGCAADVIITAPVTHAGGTKPGAAQHKITHLVFSYVLAEDFGGGEYEMPTPTFSTRIPAPEGTVELRAYFKIFSVQSLQSATQVFSIDCAVASTNIPGSPLQPVLSTEPGSDDVTATIQPVQDPALTSIELWASSTADLSFATMVASGPPGSVLSYVVSGKEVNVSVWSVSRAGVLSSVANGPVTRLGTIDFI